jgi:hypothetical protein
LVTREVARLERSSIPCCVISLFQTVAWYDAMQEIIQLLLRVSMWLLSLLAVHKLVPRLVVVGVKLVASAKCRDGIREANRGY